MSNPIWQPSESEIANSNMTGFTHYVNKEHRLTIKNYSELYAWSIKHPEAFWSAIADFSGILFSKKAQKILIDGDKMPGAKFFEGAELNFAENLLRYSENKPAIIFHNENGERVSLSYPELKQQVAQCASSLKKVGVGPNDRVAGYLPNRPETIIAMLATASLGATWSSCSLDFGYQGVFDRFAQIKPKVLFVADGHFYNGKTHHAKDTIQKLIKTLPSVEQAVLVSNIGENIDIENTVRYKNFLDASATDCVFTQVDFNHPLYIMFSSGTTGEPKCIVHGVGGTLIQHLKELQLHCDLTERDTLFYFTTCGWMMWNWMVSAMATGATLILYDGSPLHPNAERLFDIVEQEKVTVLGTSAKYITAIEKQHCIPKESHDLTLLKSILSTGSPLLPNNYDFVYEKIKSDLRLSSISGGTDIISCFALGNPNLPVFKGELQCRGLGMCVDIFDENGKSVRNEKGELVCTAPFPSMPIYFWNDKTGEKFHAAYFEKFPGVWAQGDFAEITEHDGVIIYGRSDTILNPGGVRIGTAEIYREVEKIDDVVESIAIGEPFDDDVRVILFVVLQPGIKLDETLKNKIITNIKKNVSPHHVPKVIRQVPDIPRTVSGKIVELAVKNVVMGKEVENSDALANPEALEYFKRKGQ